MLLPLTIKTHKKPNFAILPVSYKKLGGMGEVPESVHSPVIAASDLIVSFSKPERVKCDWGKKNLGQIFALLTLVL